MDPLTPVTEIASVFPSRLTGEQQPRSPFIQGQFLHGTVAAKEGGNLFSLEINGQLLTAHANTNLQVGQRLNLQVSSLAPQIELQIIPGDPINRHISKLLPLLGQQSMLADELANLGGNTALMQRLGATSQETIRLYAQELPNLTLQPQAQTLQRTEGESLLSRPETAPPASPLQVRLQAMGDLFRQLAHDSSLTSNTTRLALDLAELFTQAADKGGSPAILQLLSKATLPEEASLNTLLAAVLEKIQQNPTLNTPAPATLLSLIGTAATAPPADRLLQLLTLFTPPDQGQSFSTPQGIGLHLAEQLDRLGLDMERLFLEGKSAEAARTLKFALLEAAQSSIAEDRHSPSVERLLHNLELHQLLQMRLAGQSLFFFPLPFSFLQQGYLLVDQDQSREQQAGGHEQNRQPVQTAALHLQLDGLGNLHIDITQSGDRITLKFQTEHMEQAKYLAGFREELANWLTSGTLVASQFLVGAQEPVKGLLARILGDNTGVIDTSA